MITIIGNQIEIINPTEEILSWCEANLIVDNPDFQKKIRMNLWVGNTPKELCLFTRYNTNNVIFLPYGCLHTIFPMLKKGALKAKNKLVEDVEYKGEVPLYDYQKTAVNRMSQYYCGILQSPAGSGKTQMGIALACKLGKKTLWLTHTKDLLLQSMKRAEEYLDSTGFGTITEGEINIGSTITFATVQTMSNIDLGLYQNEWDCIIVDECHRVSGTPTAVTQFSKVLNSLWAKHKYGLSATVHRADGLIKATYAILGQVIYKVPDEAVAEKVMKVSVNPVNTGVGLNSDFLNADGTINFAKMVSYLTGLDYRNNQIVSNLIYEKWHYNLILSDRVGHLKSLYELLPEKEKQFASVIDGRTKKEVREQAIEDMRTGKKHYLFATYSLCKEGLDIPRLDRLYLTTPQKDYAVITQSIGRIARRFEGKEEPVVFDFVDNFLYAMKAYKQRCSHYRKAGCEIKEWN